MPVSRKHILQQGPVIGAIGKTAFTAFMQRFDKAGAKTVETPGPTVSAVLPPRPSDLVRDYVRHVGGDPGAYKKQVPAHMFPQWGFPLAFETIRNVPYPLFKALNGGCRIEINRPLPQGEALQVSARLEDIDDNGSRAVLHQRIVTETSSAPEAIVSHMYAIVPLAKKNGANGAKKERPRVPEGARELAFWRLGPKAGLEFAMLTGDFNPIHWIPAAARAQGFRNTILHGFATLARAIEGLNASLFSGSTDWLSTVDVKFTRPLVLPARVGLYLADDDRFFVGDAPGGPAYLTGQFTRKNASGAKS